MDTPLMTLRASPPRLWFAVLSLGTLGALMLWIALVQPPADPGWRLALLLGGAAVGWAAARIVRLRDRALVLTEEALVDTASGVVCRIADIERISTGVFALKPARGFAVVLAGRSEAAWVPGLWWRIGRSVGVGGMTAAVETRMMAERIEALAAARRRS
jgi:hypothetical protein